MIETVTMASSTFAGLPHKFEAGTPPIAQAVGLGAAVDYLTGLGMDAVHAHERHITAYALERLQQVEGLRIIGPATPRRAVPPSPSPSATCTRTTWDRCSTSSASRFGSGHHCARPVCLRYAVPATTRASFYLYSTTAEVDALVDGLEHVKRFFSRPGGVL
jgi:cysteine desulfurase/selenocysteine lyase